MQRKSNKLDSWLVDHQPKPSDELVAVVVAVVGG